MDIAKLALEDGTVFTGKAFGARGESDGEVVFNTSMTGYQEILTDPSYHGQIVTMTATADRQLRGQRRRFRKLAAVGARVCRPRAQRPGEQLSRDRIALRLSRSDTASSESRGSTPARWCGERASAER